MKNQINSILSSMLSRCSLHRKRIESHTALCFFLFAVLSLTFACGNTAGNKKGGASNKPQNEAPALESNEEFTIDYSVDPTGEGSLEATVDGKKITSGTKVKKGKEVIFNLTVTHPDKYELDAWSGATPDARNEKKAYLEVEKDASIEAKLMPIGTELKITKLKIGSFHRLTQEELEDAQEEQGFAYELPATVSSINLQASYSPKDATLTQTPQGTINLSNAEQLVTFELAKGSEKKTYRIRLNRMSSSQKSELEWLKVEDHTLQSAELVDAKSEDGLTIIARPHVNPVISWASKTGKVSIKTKKANETSYGKEIDRTQKKRFEVVMPELKEERPVSVQLSCTDGDKTTTYTLNITLATNYEIDNSLFGIYSLKLGRIYSLAAFDMEQATSQGFHYQLPTTQNTLTLRTKYVPKDATLTQTPQGVLTLTENEQKVTLELKKGKRNKTYTLYLKKGAPKAAHELATLRTNDIYCRDGDLKAAKDEYHLYRVEVPTWKRVEFAWESQADSVKVQWAQIKNYRDKPKYGAEEDKTNEKKFILPLPKQKEKYFSVKITSTKGSETSTYTIVVETIKVTNQSDL